MTSTSASGGHEQDAEGLLARLPFKDWVLKVQSSSESLVDAEWPKAVKQAGGDEELQKRLCHIRMSLLKVAAKVFVNAENFRMLSLRLQILDSRLREEQSMKLTPGWLERLPNNFEFLLQLVSLHPNNLATALSKQCR